MPGSAPHAQAWIAVEHPAGWGDAPLARSEHGVRVVMVRGERDRSGPTRVWVAHAGVAPTLRQGTVSDPVEVAGWDLAQVASGSLLRWGRPDPEPLLLVCANGRRDRCCGHDGGRLAERLRAGRWGARVLTSTHLGGHRFAPTAVLLPWGVLHGRLDADSAERLLDQATQGRTPTASLRGFSSLAEAGQVAEAWARQRTGYAGLEPLAVDVRPEDPDHAAASVELPGGAVQEIALVRVHRQVLTSCGRATETTSRWQVAPVAPA
jgi:hypothetical protein